MTELRTYMQGFQDYFWRYEEEGSVIAVPGGLTLAYTEQVARRIIPQLAPQGLPRFGSLVVALAATTTNGQAAIREIEELLDKKIGYNLHVERGIKLAKLLAQVPAQFREGNPRIILLRAIFQDSHNGWGVKQSGRVAEAIAEVDYIVEELRTSRSLFQSSDKVLKNILADFRTLAVIGKDLRSVRDILVRVAGMPSFTEALAELDTELEPTGKPGSYVEELRENPDTFHAAALVPDLIAGLNLSFRASLPSEQPLGGVADITNKGSFDKLLTSEYAFEDHVLLSRLANNEALYKHREVPPEDNVHPRVLLIDNTLKNWGVIRTLSFAVALAIREHPKNQRPGRVFLVDQSFREVSLDTVEDVIDALSWPDPSLDPGVGLTELATREDLKGAEVFFLGAADSATAPTMLRLAAEIAEYVNHWVHPAEDGTIKVYQQPRRGKRFVQELRLSLNQLWAQRRPRRRNEVDTVGVNSSAYPILFDHPQLKTEWRGKHFVYGLSKGKELFRWYSQEETNWRTYLSGWERVAGPFLKHDILKAVITRPDLSVSVLLGGRGGELCIIDFPGGERRTVGLHRQLRKAKAFYVEGDTFRTRFRSQVLVIDQAGTVSEAFAAYDPPGDAERTLPGKKVVMQNTSSFRKVKELNITEDRRLRFQTQTLRLEGEVIKTTFAGHQQSPTLVHAMRRQDGDFVFPDGSKIVNHVDGLLTLCSSNTDLPNVYLPTRLDVHLGAATVKHFAGNNFYRQFPLYEILVENAHERKNHLTLIINRCLTTTNLKRAEEMAESGVLICKTEVERAALVGALVDSNYTYSVRRRGLDQTEVSPEFFYREYIQPFIDHIIDYAANAKT